MHVEIPKATELEEKVFTIDNDETFNSIALGIYHFQFANNQVYQDYCNAIYKTPSHVHELKDIPFLPISFFKTHQIKTGLFKPELLFNSSGTTSDKTSFHFIKKSALYAQSFSIAFEKFIGRVEDHCIIGLLPSYLERDASSLVYMVEKLIKISGHPKSGFYLYDHDKLNQVIRELESKAEKTILIGVSFALLDFAKQYPQQLKHTMIIETGGMKGRQKEITREELNQDLIAAFGLDQIYSEYGMTELLSQAYGRNGKFRTPPWMKIILRDETDPFTLYPPIPNTQFPFPISGAINIIDLANLYSCSFIATDDLGKYAEDQCFEVLGRMDNSDIRGCSQLVPGFGE